MRRMSDLERVRLVALRYCAGVLKTEELPMAAAELVADGYESPALYDLAGRSRREPAFELEPLLREVLDEFGLPYPGVAGGERWLLRDLAARVVAGSMTPAELADAVIHRPLDELDRDEEALVGELAGYCDCCIGSWLPENLLRWETDVRSAAAVLAAQG